MWYTLYVVLVKSKVKISQNFVAYSEYKNFTELGIMTGFSRSFELDVSMHCCQNDDI